MTRNQQRIQRAFSLLYASLNDYLKPEKKISAIKKHILWLRAHPTVERLSNHVARHLPILEARYKNSRQFRVKVMGLTFGGIVLLMILLLVIDDGRNKSMFTVAQDEIRYKSKAPQLAFIRSEPVAQSGLPIAAPIAARVAMDDSKTSIVTTAINGRVIKQHVQLGDMVSVGDALVTIDAPEYGTALSDWQKAEADAKRKRAAFQRSRELLAGEAIARRDYEVAEADSRIADAEAKRAYLKVGNLVPFGKPDANGQELTLRAPISGVVANLNINPGREIRVDQDMPIAVVSDLSHVWIIVDASERDALKINIGDAMLVSFDNLPGEIFKATVTRISPVLDPKMRRVQVRAEIDNPDMKLRPEMYGRAQLSDPNAPQVIRIPISALITHGIYTTVFVESEPGVFRRQRVHIAFQDGQFIWLKPESDIKADDKIVTVGALLLSSELNLNSN